MVRMYSFPLYAGLNILFFVTVLGDYPEKPTSYSYSYKVLGKKQRFTSKREYSYDNGHGKVVVQNSRSPNVITGYSTYINHPADGTGEERYFKPDSNHFGDDDDEVEEFWKLYDDDEGEDKDAKAKVVYHSFRSGNSDDNNDDDLDDRRKKLNEYQILFDEDEDEDIYFNQHGEIEDNFESNEYYSHYWKEIDDISEEYYHLPDEHDVDFDFWNYFWSNFDRHGDDW